MTKEPTKWRLCGTQAIFVGVRIPPNVAEFRFFHLRMGVVQVRCNVSLATNRTGPDRPAAWPAPAGLRVPPKAVVVFPFVGRTPVELVGVGDPDAAVVKSVAVALPAPEGGGDASPAPPDEVDEEGEEAAVVDRKDPRRFVGGRSGARGRVGGVRSVSMRVRGDGRGGEEAEKEESDEIAGGEGALHGALKQLSGLDMGTLSGRTVMPFGLCNAPTTFITWMNAVLGDLMDVCMVAYMDDILIYSQTEADHQTHIAQVLENFRGHQVYVNREKSMFSKTSVEFLGHIFDATGVQVKEDYQRAVKEWLPVLAAGEGRRARGSGRKAQGKGREAVEGRKRRRDRGQDGPRTRGSTNKL
ncbi:MAG: hypothetical protein BJ554DRAFT_7137, partial [Olpidium bornovanus]